MLASSGVRQPCLPSSAQHASPNYFPSQAPRADLARPALVLGSWNCSGLVGRAYSPNPALGITSLRDPVRILFDSTYWDFYSEEILLKSNFLNHYLVSNQAEGKVRGFSLFWGGTQWPIVFLLVQIIKCCQKVEFFFSHQLIFLVDSDVGFWYMYSCRTPHW